jgi:Zn finger protein HypA/HybF involved in hydrogenase expression
MNEVQFSALKDKVMNELRKFFRPELINRFDEVIIFEPLKQKDMAQIVKLQLKSLGKLLEDQEMGFSYTDAAVNEIAREGYDPIFGARPLRRAIQKLMENPISSLIIEGKVKPGDTVQADFDGASFIFNIEHITMVPAGSVAAKTAMEQFKCNSCQTVFETTVQPNATVVCKNCASSQVVKQPKEELKPEQKPDMPPSSPATPAAPSLANPIPDSSGADTAVKPA